MADQCFSSSGAIARKDTEDARRHASFGQQLAQSQRCQGRQLAGFDDDRVARRQRGSNLLDGNEQGVVERSDERHDAQRDAVDPVVQLSLRGQHGAFFGAEERGVVLEPAHQRGHLGIHFANGAAGLLDLERDEGRQMGGQKLGGAVQDVGAVVAGRARPGAGLEGLVGLLDGGVDILFGGRVRVGKNGASGRVLDWDSFDGVTWSAE